MNRTKVTPSQRISKEIQLILEGIKTESEEKDLLSTLINLSTRKIIQESLKHEATEYLGRGYYERSSEARKGYRNGYEKKKLKTSEGVMEIETPQFRVSGETYRSRILSHLDHISLELKRLAIESYVRGLSARDIENTFKDKDGVSFLSKDEVSELSESLWEEYNAFQTRDLSSYDIVYLFVDAVYESLRKESNLKEGILCAWGIISEGYKLLLGMELGNHESADAWIEFFHNMLKRGLRMPLIVISDGSPGLRKAIKEVFYKRRRQRCIAHKLRNIANKLSRSAIKEVLPEIKAIYYAENREVAELLVKDIVEKYSSIYPSAIKTLLDDLDSCLTHLDFPRAHRRYIRTTNLLERCFEEQKRRTKIIPRFLTEKSFLKLVFGKLIRVSFQWRKVKMTDLELTILKNIRDMMCEGDKYNNRYISIKFAA